MGKYDEAAEAYSSLAEFWPDNAKVIICFTLKFMQDRSGIVPHYVTSTSTRKS